MSMLTPRDEGIEAARRGVPRDQNPYRKAIYNAEAEAFADEWDSGHDDYREDLHEKRLSSTR